MEKLKPCPYCKDYESVGFEGKDGKVQMYNFCPVCGNPLTIAGKKILASRRAEPENKVLTNFDRITQSPENLAKFLQDIWDGKIPFDNLYCDECGNCLEGGGCKENADETNCIIRWLNQTK